ncbi:MAG: DNA polymerase III subunit delta, partial [bacterium]
MSGKPTMAEEAIARAAAAAGEVVVCDRPEGAELQRWIDGQARSLGVALGEGAAAALVARGGGEPLALRQELMKLASYAGAAGSASLEDVLAVTGELAPPNVFQFLDLLFVERSPNRALGLLARLLDDMHPLQLLAMTVTQLRKLAQLKGALAAGLSDWQLASRLRLPPPLVSRMSLVVRRTPPARMAELLRALGAAEASLKLGGDGRTVLEGLVLESCR